MVVWTLGFERRAKKDAARLRAAGLKPKVEAILNCIQEDPLHFPPPYEKLIGDLAGLISRRINRQHRIVYEVLPESRRIVVYMMFSHYGE